jgi:hypothetical protein
LIVVKHSYISPRGKIGKAGGNMRAARGMAIGTALAHIKYIQHRPGEDKEKGGRELFSDTEDQADPKELRKEVREHEGNGVVVHKLLLSPEVSPTDTKAFTRDVLKALGDEKGLDLRWYATAHKNTDHHHIHVVVLPKDKNGREVRFGKRDYELIKEYGDRYLERHHPLELREAQREREDRERQRLEERQKQFENQRQERIRNGEELPWLHRKIVREQLEPYQHWNKKQLEAELAADIRNGGNVLEKPLHQDTVTAAGRDWSQNDKLPDLQRVNEYLWDHPSERIPVDDYKKLVSWIKEKEAANKQANRVKEAPSDAKGANSEKKIDRFEHGGKEYSKDDPYEKLTGLSKELRKNRERLPIEQHQQLRKWIEHKDRERFSGVIEKQLHTAKTRQDADEKARVSPANTRFVHPLQTQMMKNPIMGLFMTEASIANELVRSIVLDDRNRDYDKEARDELEDAKKDIEERRRGRTSEDQKKQDDYAIDDIDKAIDEQKEEKRKRRKERNKDKGGRDKDTDFLR